MVFWLFKVGFTGQNIIRKLFIQHFEMIIGFYGSNHIACQVPKSLLETKNF